MAKIKVNFKETENVKRFVRFVKACINPDDVVTEDFLKNEIEVDYEFMVSRGRIEEMTAEELMCAASQLMSFYDVTLTKTMKLDIVPKMSEEERKEIMEDSLRFSKARIEHLLKKKIFKETDNGNK